jgi:type IV pilus assembly protein PilB
LALLEDAVRERATDVHIEPRDGKVAAIRFRIDGALLDVALLPRATVDPLENQLKVLAQLDPSPATRPAKARWTAAIDDREVDVRLTLVPVLIGELRRHLSKRGHTFLLADAMKKIAEGETVPRRFAR